MAAPGQEEAESERQRWEVLHQLEEWLELPMLILGFAWLALLVVELVWKLTPSMEVAGTTIWVLFILDFTLRLLLAPRRGAYLQKNWLTALALLLPALRVLRFARVLRALRGIRLIRIVTSLNRGMRSLGEALGRRGAGYVAALTLLVLFAGSAGMYAFENLPGEKGLSSYMEALWWTAMLLTTIGSEYWPQTPEGRMLTLLLSGYALGVLGYLTATLASFFIDRDAENAETELASASSLERLHQEIRLLRQEMAQRDGTPSVAEANLGEDSSSP